MDFPTKVRFMASSVVRRNEQGWGIIRQGNGFRAVPERRRRGPGVFAGERRGGPARQELAATLPRAR
jgi:hypothetical protein